ncbi:MAG: lipoate--protein ligase family protein [Muribaculaceae bacterium]|nr:lipoate--protein ligase family protein [Muribaculaceae bacterium]
MIYLALPQSDAPRRVPFFLAVEEWAARSLPPEDFFFIWQQGGPTIICGRNQCIPAEVDLERACTLGVDVVRRRSGGGAVVADENNLMLSCVRPRNGRPVAELFAEWSATLASALRKAGLDARASGRNDICIGSRKVSGGAFYALPDRAIAHSTLLYRRPSAKLLSLLTPSRAKLESKGVKSVEARIGSLCDEGYAADMDNLRRALRECICSATIEISPDNIREIEAIEQRYYAPDFLKLSNAPQNWKTIHLPGTGTVAGAYSTGHVSFAGDFLNCGDVDSLARSLEKLPRPWLREHLEALKPEDTIPGMDADTLLSLFPNP